MPQAKNLPRKPRPDFPLFAHQNGQWCKKIRGKQHYFGRWAEPEPALQEYLRVKDDLETGRRPTPATGVVTLADVCNLFLERSEERRHSGEISPTTFADYLWVGERVIEHFGRTTDPQQLRPQDFAGFRRSLAAKYAPSRLSKTVTVTRMIVRWAHESELIDQMPRFGPDFKTAGKRVAREAKAAGGKKLFTASEIQFMLASAKPPMKAMILLGINGGFGNTDVASLPISAIDLSRERIEFPRPKTGVERCVPLWDETVTALQIALENRPEPASREFAEVAFLTKYRNPWVLVKADGTRTDSVVLEFRKLLKKCGLYRPRTGFYWLRHTFQTIADGAGDPIAAAHVMGHADGTIGGVYRERISDERMRKATDHVRRWLFDEGDTQPAEAPLLRVVG